MLVRRDAAGGTLPRRADLSVRIARDDSSQKGAFHSEPESLKPWEVVSFPWLKAASNNGKETDMSDWLHNLPVLWMGLVVFGFTYLVTAGIYVAVTVLAVGERARSFKAVSPGLLPPLGIIFGLFVAFTATQVWTDTEKAKAEIDREASALRSVVILATTFPRESEVQLRGLIHRYIADAATQEWSGVAASMLLILAHDRPFTGEISIRPDALLQVMPEIGT